MIVEGIHFKAHAERTELIVIRMDEKEDDGNTLYRPSYQARSPGGALLIYTGNTWTNAKLHTTGDVVAGYANWATGEMRSIRQTTAMANFGQLFFRLSLFGTALYSVLLFGPRIWKHDQGGPTM